MGFLTGLAFPALGSAAGSFVDSLAKKRRGGLFGTGITADEIAQGIGAYQRLIGGQPQPAAPPPAQFQPMPSRIDLSGLNGGIERRPIPPLNLADYFRQLGYGGGS